MQEIEMKGKNVEEAIQKALEKLGCSRNDAEIKVLDEGTSGLFGLMGAKPARVLVSAQNCKNAQLPEADPKQIVEKTKKILTDILTKTGMHISTIAAVFDKEALCVNAEIEVEESGYIIGRNGQTLDAVEYITQIIVNNDLNSKIKLNLDCEKYRQKQTEKLQVLADKAVDYVNRTGKIYRFDPMNAKERKIIHTYLKDSAGIETFSEGEGIMRKVGIKLSKA